MKTILAEIINIGDEILYGQITNTNAQWLSQALDKIGVKVARHTAVADTNEAIRAALKSAEALVDIVLITGGLGPTKDDITKKTIAEYFATPLVPNESVLQHIIDFFAKRGREIQAMHREQALMPEAAEIIFNRLGTAPAMWFERGNKVFVSMPGVPKEMKILMEDTILKKLQKHFETPVIYHKTIRTFGAGESKLAEKIEAWEDNLPENMKLAYLPNWGEVRLRLTAFGDNRQLVEQAVQNEIDKMLPLIQTYVFGYDETSLEEAIADLLRKKGLSISTAESCTGGYLAHLFTKVAGCSDYYQGGIVAYSNAIKANQLGVSPQTLENHGAVSEETIREMAENVRQRYQTDIGVASSGIAGPGGGSPEKPVGTVWIAYSDQYETYSKKLQLSNDRELNIQFSARIILDLIRKRVEKNFTASV